MHQPTTPEPDVSDVFPAIGHFSSLDDVRHFLSSNIAQRDAAHQTLLHQTFSLKIIIDIFSQEPYRQFSQTWK